MKTLPAYLFIAAFVAFVALPINFVAALSLLFAAGLVAILISDYTRASRLLRLRTAPVAALPAQRTERLGLAA